MNKHLFKMVEDIKKEHLGEKTTLVGLDSIIKWYAEEWDDGQMWANPILDNEYTEMLLEKGGVDGIHQCGDDCVVFEFNVIETNINEDGEYWLTVVEITNIKVMNSTEFIFS